MTPREQLDRLTTAKEELLLVLRSLDTRSTDHDYQQHRRVYDTLNGAITRLEKAQNLITGGARTPEFWDRVKEKLKNGATSTQEGPT